MMKTMKTSVNIAGPRADVWNWGYLWFDNNCLVVVVIWPTGTADKKWCERSEFGRNIVFGSNLFFKWFLLFVSFSSQFWVIIEEMLRVCSGLQYTVHIGGYIWSTVVLQQSWNQENVHVGVKNVVLGARPAATKRSALEEIVNDRLVNKYLVPKQVGRDKLYAPLRK